MRPSRDTVLAHVRSSRASPFRVLLVTDEMEVGGTQRQIVNLAVGLQDIGVEVCVLYFRLRSFLVDELEQHGIRVFHCPKRAAVDPAFVCSLAHLLRSGRYDVVHAFAFSAELWSAVALMMGGGGRITALLSSVRGTYDWYSPLQWRVKRWVSSRCAAVVANSREGARFAAHNMGMGAHDVAVVYNGIRPARVGAAERDRAQRLWPVPEGGVQPLRLLFVGRLVDIKGVDTLITALAVLPPAGFSLALCGDGPLRDALERQAAKADVGDRVRFLGERPDAACLIEACDVLVLPSRQEGLSNALLEAMAAGRAVVASAVGGNTELVTPEQTGLLFASGDAEALAAALLRLQLNPALRARLGAQAAAFVDERFSVSAMVAAMHRLYRTAARKSLAEEPLIVALQPASRRLDARGLSRREH
jgi:glycosyltransferase involved in cell wall biosynthesis